MYRAGKVRRCGAGRTPEAVEGMEEPFVPAVDPPEDPGTSRSAWWFAFRGAELLVVGGADDATVEVPMLAEIAAADLGPVRRQYLGALSGRDCWSIELGADVEAPAGMAFEGLRALYGRLDERRYALAGRAAQIVAWDRDHQFCGRCGTPTEPVPGERARRCPRCGLTSFPRLSPAVIVLIERGETILLARGRQFPEGFYGIIAGFVEPGESLEEAVRREVREEVGIEIADLRYFGSQPWPYPHALMIGFTARHAAGEIRLDGRELAEAGWFGIDTLPRIPQKLSIARRLIDAWAVRQGREIAAP